MIKTYYDKFNGRDVCIYTIADGMVEVDICELGARINAIRVNGADIALGCNSVDDYLESGSYAGATIGRVANRIANGRFVLNGRLYYVSANEGANHLHGGILGFDKRLFAVLSQTDNSLLLQYVSADGEEGYPGKLTLTVRFSVEKGALTVNYSAVSDKDTLWCPTNHTYFNLDGENSGDCRSNMLKINADKYTPTGAGLIPSGVTESLEGTPFDFRKIKAIGADFGEECLKETNGYDHNYILKGECAAHAKSLKTGIEMDVYTDMPCLQLYTGGAIKPCRGKNINYGQWSGFCLEPQYCPNAVNMNGFEVPVLKARQVEEHYIKYVFVR